MKHCILLFLVLNVIALVQSTIVLPAVNQTAGAKNVGLIFVQGAQIPAENYVKTFQALQQKFNGNLWIALTEFPLDTPQPITLGSEINNCLSELKKAGFKFTKETPFFFAGHSLGTVFLQDYILNRNNIDSMECTVKGLILEGGYIVRKNRNLIENATLIESVLSIGGELDGLNRISRMAESLYFDMKFQNNGIKRMTHLIPGMNHYQFAGEGVPPSNVQSNDITAEITNEEARENLSYLLAAYLRTMLQMNTANDDFLINASVKLSQEMTSPLIDGFLHEGSYHLNTPCYQLQNPVGSGCTQGSPWSEFAQKMMGTLNVSMQVTDSFHPVYQVNPVHLPAIHNNCAKPHDCTLNVTTVSEPIYGWLDGEDVSLEAVGASEIKTKMMSRQQVLISATGQIYPLNETDGQRTNCADINQATIEWAKKRAPAKVLERYLKSKRQLRVGADKGPYNAGPLWIWTYLEYNQINNSMTGESYVELRAPMMFTDYNYPISAARSFHYCKVLSPARAIEWIYVDSIKP